MLAQAAGQLLSICNRMFILDDGTGELARQFLGNPHPIGTNNKPPPRPPEETKPSIYSRAGMGGARLNYDRRRLYPVPGGAWGHPARPDF